MLQSPPKACKSRANIMNTCASSTILYNVNCCMFLGNSHLSLYISIIEYRETSNELKRGRKVLVWWLNDVKFTWSNCV